MCCSVEVSEEQIRTLTLSRRIMCWQALGAVIFSYFGWKLSFFPQPNSASFTCQTDLVFCYFKACTRRRNWTEL